MVQLTEVERKVWIDFHESAYKDDFAVAKKLAATHPRWAVICGYYAMHDIAKLYLGKTYNIKVVGPEIHRQTIDELGKVLELKEEKERIIKLLEEAEDEIREVEPDSIPYMLIAGKRERGKAQYYSERTPKGIDYSKKALWFMRNIAQPFIKIMEGLLNAS